MNSRRRTLRRNYGKLSDIERFRLVVAARSRGDRNEEEALMRTAPRAVYSDVAISFSGMIRGLEMAALATVIDLLNGGVGLLSELSVGMSGPREEAALQSIVERAKQVVAVSNSLGLFCQRVGVSRPGAIEFAPWPPAIEGLVELARYFAFIQEGQKNTLGRQGNAATAPEAVETDISEIAEEYASSLQRIWEREAAQGQSR